jgi:hypothetical protein
MRKSAILLILMMIFAAACSDGDDAFGPDPNVSAGTMQEVTVVSYHGETNVSLVELWTTVSSDRKIDVEIVPLAGNPKALDACNGSAEISEEDYQDVVAAVAAVGPMSYESSSQEDCDTLSYLYCLDVLYLDVSGEEASFSIDIIAIDPIVSDLTSLVGGLSIEYVPECFDDNDPDDDDDDNGDDDGADSDIVVYDVPIINPRDLPRPTRVEF